VTYKHLAVIIKMTFAKAKTKQTVAIVGSGMAGLVTAYLLHHDMHERYSVTVFESVRMSQKTQLPRLASLTNVSIG
jgi:2-polyprenyl-6-methoxyphenol hydroxylase-like FAD-dependent oxidoreductase